jgi:hypothetical protein
MMETRPIHGQSYNSIDPCASREATAAWATPDRARYSLIDMSCDVIPDLYCGGEAAVGFSQHGLARATCLRLYSGEERRSGAERKVTPANATT